MDNFELVDNDLSTVSNAGRIHSNLIRLKKSSFMEISKKWTNFRLARLTKKLEKKQEKMNDIVNTVPFEKMEDKVMGKAKVIAKLEEKIKILAKEEVPVNYVNNRAIKLKDAMMKEVRAVSDEVYAKEAEVDYGFTDFADTGFDLSAATDISKEIFGDDEDDENENNVSVEQEPIDREKIEQSINEAFAAKDNVEVPTTGETIEEPISIVEDNPIEGENDALVVEEENPVNNAVEEPISVEDIAEPVEVVSEEQESIDVPVSPISREEIEENAVEEETVPSFKVVSNEATPAKIDKFDSEGNYKSVSNIYDSMTAEDLVKARENIEFDKYEENYAKANNDENVRDDVVVVDDEVRDNTDHIEEYTVVQEDEDLHFDYSNATVNDLNNAVSVATSEQDLRAMMARAAELNAARAKTKAELEEARKLKADEEQRVLEAKKITEEKEQKRSQRIKLLQDYIEASNQDYEYNKQAIESARAEAENNRRMVEEEKMKGNQIDKEISEIEAMMSPFIEDDANNPQHIRVVK